MFDIALRIFILTVNFWYLGNGSVLDSAYFPFIIGVIALFAVAMASEKKRSLKTVYPALFLGYCIVNFLLHNAQMKSLPALTSVFFGVMLFYLVLSYSENFARLITTFKIVALINVAWLAMQYLNVAPMLNGVLCGFYERSSSLSASLILTAPFIPILTAVLFAIPNYTGIMVGVLLSVRLGAWYLVVVALVGLFIVYSGQSSLRYKYDSRHQVLYEATQETLLKANILGHGLDSFKGSELAKKHNWDIELKCEPVEWFYWTGFVGLVFAGLWIREILRKAKGMILLAISGFFLMGLTQGVFQNVKLLSMFLPLVAWAYIQKQEAKLC